MWFTFVFNKCFPGLDEAASDALIEGQPCQAMLISADSSGPASSCGTMILN